jgi:hypothetical protein
MTFEQVKPFLAAGLAARRKDWTSGCRIQFTADFEFGVLFSCHGVKAWQPYWLDFFADDWEVLGCSCLLDVRKALTTALREASAINA